MNPLEVRADVRTLFYNAIDLYCDHRDTLFKHQDEEAVTLLRDSFPRTLYELSFLDGQRAWLEHATTMDPNLRPEEESELTFILNIDREKDSLSMGTIQYPKLEDEVSWQQWRLDSFDWEEYKQRSFPPYLKSGFINATTTKGTLRSNVSMEIEEEAQYRLQRGKTVYTFPFQVEELRTLSPSSGYRWEYAVRFPKPLPGSLAQRLQR